MKNPNEVGLARAIASDEHVQMPQPQGLITIGLEILDFELFEDPHGPYSCMAVQKRKGGFRPNYAKVHLMKNSLVCEACCCNLPSISAISCSRQIGRASCRERVM